MSKDDLRLEAVGKTIDRKRLRMKAGFAALFLIFAVVAGCSAGKRDPLPEEKQVSKEKISATKRKLLFFINPNGYPCQLQERILSENAAEIDAYADVEYVSTAAPKDRGKFYKYGIRALPMLVLLDKEGNVIKRFSPGIKKIGEIMQDIKKGMQGGH